MANADEGNAPAEPRQPAVHRRRASDDSVVETSSRAVSFGVRGLWLLFLYLMTISLVIASFSAHQFQNKAQKRFAVATAASGGNDSVAPVKSLGELLGLYAEYAPLRKRVAATAHNIEDVGVRVGEAESRYTRARADLIAADGVYIIAQEELVSALDVADTRALADSDPEQIDVRAQDTIGVRAGYHGDNTDIAALHNKLLQAQSKQIAAQGLAEARKAELDDTRQLEREARVSLEDRIAKRDEFATNFKAKRGDDSFALLNELIFFENAGFIIFYMPDPLIFPTMPPAILTLILTLSMGALGSVIYVTRYYFSTEPARAFSWYIFRPFLGMITALAVYVFAKAGQLSFSDASLDSSLSEGLNPFVLSFLAIISGLLSEQAITWLTRSGSRLFGEPDGGNAGAGGGGNDGNAGKPDAAAVAAADAAAVGGDRATEGARQPA